MHCAEMKRMGADIKVDEPLVSMETAKAVVEVPSPFTGKDGTNCASRPRARPIAFSRNYRKRSGHRQRAELGGTDCDRDCNLLAQ